MRDVRVPMRDSVDLVADLYYPAADGRPVEGKLPAVLQRTPLQKGKLRAHGEFLRQTRLPVSRTGLPWPLQNLEAISSRFEMSHKMAMTQWYGSQITLLATGRWVCMAVLTWRGCSSTQQTQNPPGLATIIPYEGTHPMRITTVCAWVVRCTWGLLKLDS